MRFHQILIAISLMAVMPVCTLAQNMNPDGKPAQEPAKALNLIGSLARMMPGEWKMTAQSGSSIYDIWHWGPGKHSLRVMTHGADASGNPWRDLQVVYWHPGRRQVCLWGASPFARGVSEGTIKFDGDTVEAAFDLYQTGDRRKLVRRWVFDGPDKYHAALLDATGPAGLAPFVEWDYVRSQKLTPLTPLPADSPPKPSEYLKAFEPLLGQSRKAEGNWATGEAFHVQSTFEWIPYADAIYVRTTSLSKEGEDVHLLDAYIYHHTGANVLRCLALSSRGGVYEGDVAVLDDGALQFDLTEHEGDRVGQHVVRLNFETDATVRDRIWSGKGAERTLVLDVYHKKSDPKNN